MREILFRGKDIVGNWYAGNLAVIKQDLHNGAGTIKAGSYISNKCGVPFAYQVRPETVGQYTGLTDKNGKKIFEGDILRDGKGEDGVVTYIDSIACFMAVRDGKEAWDLNEGDTTRPNKLQYTEIIGNIHDQKEDV